MTTDPTEEQTGALGSEQERVAKIIRETVIGAYTGDCAGMDEVTLYRVEKAAAEILAALSPEARPVLERDYLGRAVREAWVRWALTQPNPKPSWLAPYDDLLESDKEADRQIGEAILALAQPTPRPVLEREEIARIIDPSSWAVMDYYLADVKRIKNAGYDPESFKDKRSLAKADAIIALTQSTRGGEGK